MTPLTPSDPDFAARVRDSFDRQGIMRHLGARLSQLEPGFCEIELPFRPELSQQDGFFHAGALTTIADSAAGYAAFTLMPTDARVLTVELKINLLAPGAGERAIARHGAEGRAHADRRAGRRARRPRRRREPRRHPARDDDRPQAGWLTGRPAAALTRW
jgi:uncharacterized protein (TIGR00369 family)